MQAELTHYQQRVESQLSDTLQQLVTESVPHTLKEALLYATLNGGKRLRPALIYAIGEALNIPLEKLDSAACAMELIHSYSLVHDDLPAMDDDELRRGQPTCHIQFDEATAILVGDAQQTLAFQILAADTKLSAEHRSQMVALLAQAAGINGMIGGQMHDIESENKTIELQQLKQLHLMKTGALITQALHMGACQSPNYGQIKESLQQLGQSIGLAFQVQDDILDIESDTETLGKPQGSDEALNKSTYPALLGMEAAKTYRDELITSAQQHYQQLGIESVFLSQLIEYIAKRNH